MAAPFDIIGSALDRIGEGIANIGQRIWSYFAGPLSDIWNSIKELPGLIVSGIQDMLVFLFVPEEDFFSNKFHEIRESFTAKLGVDTSALDDLKNVSGIDLDSGFEGSLYGQRVKFVDLSWFDEFKSKFHDVARGFIYPLLVLYNLNQIYFLIRGSYLFGKSKGDD